VEILREHGRTLKHVSLYSPPWLWSAVRAAALPNLKDASLFLKEPVHREILSEGVLRHLEDVSVMVKDED
jgi:hypothetical protein